MKIFKYPIAIIDCQAIEMPHGANILNAQLQNGIICLWAEVEPRSTRTVRMIEVIGTGNDMDETRQRRYIGTVQTHEGALVWHIYERLN